MRKMQKKVLGLVGLSVVAATTVYAAFLPVPSTQAVSSNVTDTIVVRVRSGAPDVSVTEEGGDDGQEISPDRVINYDYSNVNKLTIILEYTDKDGVTHTTTLDEVDIDTEHGSGAVNLDLASEGMGYGDYLVRVIGERDDGVTDEATVSIAYYPLTATASPDDEIDRAKVDINYDPGSTDIDTIEINVYDADGNLIEGLSPVFVTPPEVTAGLDFGKYGLDEGTYTIAVTALNADGAPLYNPYLVSFVYKYDDSAVVPVPDTGGLFNNLNISRTDYLVTGLVAFGLTAVAGIVFAAKNRDKSGRSQKRR